MTERHDTEIARKPYRITTSQYYRMLETRVLNEDDRVELLDGQILIKEPASPSHSGYTSRIANLLRHRLDGLALVREQHPIHLDDYNEPEPDVAVVRPREDDYIHAHPRPEDVLLLVEVGLSSTPGRPPPQGTALRASGHFRIVARRPSLGSRRGLPRT